ncbi:AI-2E family transporter [Spirochaetota bacterium]
MNTNDRTIYSKIQTFSLAFLALLACAWVLSLTKSFMVPFMIAVLFAYLFFPLADLLEKAKVPTVLTTFILLLIIFIVIAIIGVIIYSAFDSIKSHLPDYLERFRILINNTADSLGRIFNTDVMSQYRNMTFNQFFKVISPSSIVSTINKSAGNFINFLSKMTLVMVFLMFILLGRKLFKQKLYKFFSADRDNDTLLMIRSITKQIRYFLLLKTIISLVTGTMFGLAAMFLGLDFPIIWGFIAFLFNFIPSLGPIAASLLAILLAFIQFPNFWYALLVSLILSTIQFISGNIVEPKVMGNNLNLNIIAILLSLFLWGIIWGIPGMFLAVPITVAINIICANIPKLKRINLILSR